MANKKKKHALRAQRRSEPRWFQGGSDRQDFESVTGWGGGGETSQMEADYQHRHTAECTAWKGMPSYLV